MRHYFVAREHNSDEFFEFGEVFRGENFLFKSCSDVFSKNELDYGSKVLVGSILNHSDIFSGKIMDMCCGYGTIAILLSRFIDAEYYMCDVNSTAVELAINNVTLNKSNIDTEKISCGNMFDGIEMEYDHIVSNPPIKAGKSNLLAFVDGSYSHLKVGGTLTIVIKKNLGADSLKKYLISLFGNAEVWERDKGYYILHAMKK
ncbi:MAG: class I SAM-dependent methyltransferase [Clostridiales bacterium]|nr:class I SAM-dependent methyltransferase [Clostridiales bacterium]